MKRFALALLLTGCSSSEPHPPQASDHPRPPAPPAASAEVTIVSFNVNYGLPGDETTLDAIADIDADIVALQETNAAWEEALRARLSARYPAMDFRHCCLAGGLAVLSRFPLTWRATSHPEGAWFPAARYDVDSPLGHLALVNVHLRPNVSDEGGYVSGMLTTPAVRRREMGAHLQLLEGTDGLSLVAGDFNEAADGGAVRLLEQRGFVSVDHLTGSASTWRWPTPLGDLRMQFDHVLVGRRLVPREAQVVDAGRSDHLPVLAVVGSRATPVPVGTSSL